MKNNHPPNANGIGAFAVKSGEVGKASLKLKAKGANLAIPALPLALPVTAQVVNDTNTTCFQSVFTAATSDPASTEKWKAKND